MPLSAGCAGGKPSYTVQTVLDFIYDKINMSPDGQYAIVQKDGKYGAFTRDGDQLQQVLPPEYAAIQLCGPDTFAATKDQTAWMLYDVQGESLFPNTYSDIQYDAYNAVYYVIQDGRTGLVDAGGGILIEPVYGGLSMYPQEQSGLCFASNDFGENGLLDTHGAQLLPLTYNYLNGKNGYILYDTTQGGGQYYGVLDLKLQEVLPPVYLDMQLTDSDAYPFTALEDWSTGKRFTLDSDGNAFLQGCGYDGVSPMADGYFMVVQGGKYGVVDKDNHVVLPIIYDGMTYDAENHVGLLQKGGQRSLVDGTGKQLTDKFYDDIQYYAADYKQVRLDGRIGYLNDAFELAVPADYESGGREADGLICVRSDGKWGYITPANEVKIDFQYDSASTFQEGIARVSRDGKAGFIDADEKTVVPFDFDDVYTMKSSASPEQVRPLVGTLIPGRIQPVVKNGKWGCILIP